MGLPDHLWDVEEETAVVGDVDAFMRYVESGIAYQEWKAQVAFRHKELRKKCGGRTDPKLYQELTSPPSGPEMDTAVSEKTAWLPPSFKL